MSPKDRFRRRPELESLEGRELLTKGVVPTSFLFSPIPENAQLAEHIHPQLTILINGQQQSIPAGIGISPNGALPLHTHDGTGTIHIESTAVLPFRLKDFFTIWGQSFDKNHILNATTDRKHRIVMTVNGRPSQAFGTLPLRDFQDIVIRFVTVPSRKR